MVAFAEYYHLIPHFYLKISSSSTYFDLIFIRAIGLCTTLIISSYLITSIKKRIEERGKKVEVELNHYKSLDKIKSNFILQVTHELRGPLAALKGYHEMILKGITGETNNKTKDTIKKADRRTENLLIIIDEMIDYSYMKSEEEVRFAKSEVRMRSVIDYNLDLFLNQAKEKDIRLVSNCSKDLIIWSNRDLLNIILNNLISNAIKYSLKGKTVTVNAEEDNEQIYLLIKDRGIGIKPDELNKIFEDFYRSRKAREIERDGTGLGLSIVKKAVESLNGKITVYSEEQKGTTFHIYLPKSIPEKTTNGGNNGQ